MNDSILAIIPARGGSKGIPRKNLQIVAGRTLLAWAIEVAKESGICTDIVVSTDDPEIQTEAIRVGARCPFLRPAELATDTAPTYPVVVHALQWMEKKRGERYDYIILLQPTAPLRTAEDIRAAFKLLKKSGASSLVSLCKISDPHPLKTHKIVDGRVYTFVKGEKGVCHVRRQDLPEAYALNGAIYLSQREILKKSLLADDVVAYSMPEERSVNIDSTLDLELVRLIADKYGYGTSR